MAESLIGKTYHVVDNSWKICITDDSKSDNTIGRMSAPGITNICSEPFEANVRSSITSRLFQKDMILVQASDGELYRVLFYSAQVK